MPLLLRAARGLPVSRPPVWLMRQAGRYMSAFRAYSERLPFRERSETPDIAVELSLQPYRAYATDGIIMFSDILTPLPAVGIDFDITPGKGPVIPAPLRTLDAANALAQAPFAPDDDLPFVAEVLHRLRDEIAAEATPPTLLGFVGAPFTLAAYAIEGCGVKNLVEVKRLMYAGGDGKAILQTALDALAEVVGEYACFQARHGAQVVQFFDSWAHHLSPDQYKTWALPAVRRSMAIFKQHHPEVPAVFFAHGCGGKIEDVADGLKGVMDVLQVDWSVDMADVRRRVGKGLVLQGNVDPALLCVGSEDEIRKAVRECVLKGGEGMILNLGHGVIKETPEEAVGFFCDEARKVVY